MVHCVRWTSAVWLVARLVALQAGAAGAVSECFRPQAAADLAAAIAPLRERNSSSSLRVCLDAADDKCASLLNCYAHHCPPA